MRVRLAVLLLLVPLAGCLGEPPEEASPVVAEPAPALSGGVVSFRCDDPSAPCPAPLADAGVFHVGRSLRDPDRLVAAARTDSTGSTGTHTVHVLTTDDGASWHRQALPDLPLRDGELRPTVLDAVALEAPDGSLHVLLSVNVSPGLFGTPDGSIPPPRGFLAHATAPDGTTWQPMVRALDHSTYISQTRLHWLEGEPWATWRHDDAAGSEDATGFAPLSDLDGFQAVARSCSRYETVTAGDSVLVSCHSFNSFDGSTGMFRIQPEHARPMRVETPCAPGRFVEDAGDLWFVSACEHLYVSRYNGTGFEPVLAVPLDVPSLQGNRTDVVVEAADRDDTGTWHAVLRAETLNADVAVVCRCSEEWRVYLAVGPDGTPVADVVLHDDRAQRVYGDQVLEPSWFNPWVRSFGTGTLVFRSTTSIMEGFWVDVEPRADPA